MQSALNAPQLCSEEAAFAYVESRLWPDGPVCPHCGTVGEATQAERQKHAPRPLEMPRLPQAVHGAHGDCVRVQPCSAAYLASGDLPDVLQQKGDRDPTASPHFRRQPQDGVVPRASHPRGDDRPRMSMKPTRSAAANLSRPTKPSSAAKRGTAHIGLRHQRKQLSPWSNARAMSALTMFRR